VSADESRVLLDLGKATADEDAGRTAAERRRYEECLDSAGDFGGFVGGGFRLAFD
jgi:hypothetical protein